MKIAILDDYQNIALEMADWSALSKRADITVFRDHVSDPSALVERLLPFYVVCAMRERTPLPREVLQSLRQLRLIASTGPRNASIDMAAAGELGITVTHTGYSSWPTIELTWALILRAHGASFRRTIRSATGAGKTRWAKTSRERPWESWDLAISQAGRTDRSCLRHEDHCVERKHDSRNRRSGGSGLASKNELFRQADIVTIHVVLSERTKGLVGAAELGLMKPTSRLINTSRGRSSTRDR